MIYGSPVQTSWWVLGFWQMSLHGMEEIGILLGRTTLHAQS